MGGGKAREKFQWHLPLLFTCLFFFFFFLFSFFFYFFSFSFSLFPFFPFPFSFFSFFFFPFKLGVVYWGSIEQVLYLPYQYSTLSSVLYNYLPTAHSLTAHCFIYSTTDFAKNTFLQLLLWLWYCASVLACFFFAVTPPCTLYLPARFQHRPSAAIALSLSLKRYLFLPAKRAAHESRYINCLRRR